MTRKLGKISIFNILNTGFLLFAAILCILPMIHIVAVSFSSGTAALVNRVTFWPVGFSLDSYQYVARNSAFWIAMVISVKRIFLGGGINLLLTILVAYPLSKEKNEFRFRSFYAWTFFITMLFSGGLIPWYMVIRQIGLVNNIWALVLPGAVPVFSAILLLNFFRELPKELSEAAVIDGAGHWTSLWKIYVPASTPALAAILLFSLVAHWNSWFDGLILMNNPQKYPVQSYIQTVVIQRSYSMITRAEIDEFLRISDRTLRAAQIFLGALPMIVVYPFLQKYFVNGIILGNVKEKTERRSI